MTPNSVPETMGPESGGYEKRDVNLFKVLLFSAASVIALIVIVLFMLDYFAAAKEKIVYETVLKPESAALRELRAREQEELGSYDVIDSARGTYRIPIEVAMKIMADEAYRTRPEDFKP